MNMMMHGKALIVDDNQDNRYLLDTILKSAGLHTVCAEDGEQALKKLRSDEFDLVVSDILMPVMDGFQFCRECKKDPKLKGICFVFYTATYTDDKDEKLALAMGADRFIRKPVEPDWLLDALKTLLEHRRRMAPRRKGEEEAESQVLTLYNQRLVEKLENKMLDLKKSQTRYQNLWENVSDLIFSLDEDNKVLDINHCQDILGYDPEEVVGRPLSDFMSPESASEMDSHLRKARHTEGKSKDVYEVTILRKNGSMMVAELNVCTVNIGGKFTGRYGIARDVTGRKKAEMALKQAASELQTQKEALNQKNLALRELLSQIEEEKTEIQKQVSLNVHKLIMPAVHKLRKTAGGDAAHQFDILEQGLRDLTSKFGARISAHALNLTPRQIELCNMIRNGLSNKEMAEALHLSVRTVETHRNTIRKRLGISAKDINLAICLRSFES